MYMYDKCNVRTIIVYMYAYDMYQLVSTGLTQEDRKWSQRERKFVDWDVNNQNMKICMATTK